MEKRRYAQIGLGARGQMYYRALAERYADTSMLVGLCDSNEGRTQRAVGWIRGKGGEAEGFSAAQFDDMIARCKPDVVIVTTKDADHDKYICRSLRLGCEVITEKPMTTDADKCQRIVDAQRQTGRKCTVTFNARYLPHVTQVKDLLMSGIIGNVLSVDFHWMLDTRHGADYFRRWHRNKRNSGGLLIHKATHHFDMINWWLSSIPVSVFAQGQRSFYTPGTADRFGLKRRAERCLDCSEKGKCRFHLDLHGSAEFEDLYLSNEKYDGYHRDGCVFSDEIDIEDSMHLIVNYQEGVKMSYSLNAFMPWEGFTVILNGARGRLEHRLVQKPRIYGDGRPAIAFGEGTLPAQLREAGSRTTIYPHFGQASAVDSWLGGEGTHGGADELMMRDLFAPDVPPDKYQRKADQRAGAYSALVGVAANRSMASNQLVYIDDLVHDIGLPDFPPMPSAGEPLSFSDAVPINPPQPPWL